MRIGLMASMSVPPDAGLDQIAELASRAESDGFSSVWTSGRYDALTQLAVLAARTSTIELGTGVVQTFPRHPVALAQQALAVQVVSGGRVALGIGLSHRVSMEEKLGFDWSRPIRHMREYLTCLDGLLAGNAVTFHGEEFRIDGLSLPVAKETTPPSVLVAALGPQMLRLTGRLAAGTILWLGGDRYVADVVVPNITGSASRAGAEAPRIISGLPVIVTDDVDAGREFVMQRVGRMGEQPVYRSILEMDGSESVADVAVIGDEAAVSDRLAAIGAAGATDFAAHILGRDGTEWERTYALLAGVVGT